MHDMATHHFDRRAMKRREFTLVEVVTVLVLTGILSAVAGLFLETALEAFTTTRINSAVSQKAQLAVCRISRELIFATAAPVISPGGTAITFSSRYPGEPEVTRTISWNSGTGLVTLGADVLIDGISACSFSAYGDGTIGISMIPTTGITLSTRVLPRTWF